MKRLFLLGACFSSYYTSNAQWVATNGIPAGTIMTCFASNGSTVYAGTIGSGLSGIFSSDDDGANWISMPNSPSSVYAIAVKDSQILISSGFYVGLSNNNGNTWTSLNTGCASIVNAVAFSDSLFVVGGSCGIRISSDYGSTWSLSLSTNEVYALLKSGNNIVAAGYSGFFTYPLAVGSWQYTGYSFSHTTCL